MTLSLRKLEGLHGGSQSHEVIERTTSVSSLISSLSRRSSRHHSVTSEGVREGGRGKGGRKEGG